MKKNKRFILDTNILVSALLIKNSPAIQVIEIIEKIGIILYSETTFLELKQVLNRRKFKKYFTEEQKQTFIVKLIETSELIEITENITSCRDPKDNKFLELAVSGKANFIITGDKDLLVLNPFRNIKIITINEFLNQNREKFQQVLTKVSDQKPEDDDQL
jgi:uncharacterized protein